MTEPPRQALTEPVALLPCPHCGSPAIVGSSFEDDCSVMCSRNNDDCGSMIGWRKTEAEAIEAWNRRPVPALSSPICDHDWAIWPETDGQEQRCRKCGAYRSTPPDDKFWLKPALSSQGSVGDEDGERRVSCYSPENARLVLIETLLSYREPMQELADDVRNARPCDVPSWVAMDALRSAATLPTPAPSPVADLVAGAEYRLHEADDGLHLYAANANARIATFARGVGVSERRTILAALSAARTGGVA